MTITDIRPIRAGNYLFVEVATDNGITGVGEAGAWSFLDATVAAIQKLREFVLGADPFAIEHHWQAMYRTYYFRGAIIMSAISAIDIALWDIKGKALGVPIYELLGGRCRDRVRTYAPVFEFSAPKMAEECMRLKERGFTAARLMITERADGPKSEIMDSIYARKIERSIEKVAACRKAVGNDFDLCLEVHRSMNPAEAVAFIRGVEPYRPMFVEDPIPPDSADAFRDLVRRSSVPIATGERYISIQEFEVLLAGEGAQYVRPDLCALGGITAAKKVAAIAEASYVGVVPHNPLGPVSTAACLQLDACIPNFAIQEFPSFYEAGNDAGMMVTPFAVEDGCLLIPEGPGLGIELLPDLEQKHPAANGRSAFRTHTSFDGSVRDF